MPFLLHSKNQFVLVDTKNKQGLFYQLYNPKGFSRPTNVQHFTPSVYSALLTESNTLYIAAPNNKNQVMLYSHFGNQQKKTILLEDPKHAYNFNHLCLVKENDVPHLFYSVTSPSSNSRSLLKQNLEDPSVSPITTITSFTPSSPLKYFIDHKDTFLFYCEEKENLFYINVISSSANATVPSILLTSEFPILDFDIIILDNVFHIVYIENAFGRSRLCYINSKQKEKNILGSFQHLKSPCIFKYLDSLWINYSNSNTLYTMLSIDDGVTFSSSIKSSIQSNLHHYTYHNSISTKLIASTMYASVFNTIKLAVVSLLDIDAMHPNASPNRELDLLIEGLQLRQTHLINKTFNSLPSTEDSTQHSSPPVPNPSSETDNSETRSLDSAVKDFMKNSNTFDGPTSAPPSIPHTIEEDPSKRLKSAAKGFMKNMNTFDVTPKD